MLNTVLTVRAHQANSHQGKGWEQFTDAIIRAVNEQDRPIVYMLWGKPAQTKIPMLNNPKHLILKAPIQVRCLLTEDFSGAIISARQMHFWKVMMHPPLIGRLKIYNRQEKNNGYNRSLKSAGIWHCGRIY